MSTPEQIHLSLADTTEVEEQAVLAAIRSGWVAPLGPSVDAFEAEMAQRVGVSCAVALSSGTAALHLALLGLGTEPGEFVLTSTMTFAATANSIVYTGAVPYFIDSDPATGNMDPALLEEALSQLRAKGEKIGAIMPVDLLGKSADYTRIERLAAEYDVPVIADAAESLGASHAARPAGSFGHAAALSFNGNKIMTTSGGGMLLTDDPDLAERTRYLATQARQPVAHYEHTDIGYNYRMSNILAALGSAQLTRLDTMIARRQHWRSGYRDLVAGIPGVEIFGGEGDEHDNAWLTAILVEESVAKWTPSALREHLTKERIESRPVWKPMHLQPVFADYPGLINGVAERLFDQGVTLPSGSGMAQGAFDRVCASIRTFAESNGSSHG